MNGTPLYTTHLLCGSLSFGQSLQPCGLTGAGLLVELAPVDKEQPAMTLQVEQCYYRCSLVDT
jgi:hypothetical protein